METSRSDDHRDVRVDRPDGALSIRGPNPRAITRNAPDGSTRLVRPSLPGARGHQVLRPGLEARVERPDRCERVDLVRPLVEPEVRDPREPQGEPALVPVRPHDHVEGDLDHDEW